MMDITFRGPAANAKGMSVILKSTLPPSIFNAAAQRAGVLGGR